MRAICQGTRWPCTVQFIYFAGLRPNWLQIQIQNKYRRHRHLSCSEDCLPFCGFCPHWLHSLPSLFKLNNQQINSRKKANSIFSGCATMVASYCLAFAILLSLATPSSFSQVLSKLSIFDIWLMQKVMIKTMTKFYLLKQIYDLHCFLHT